MLLSPPLPSWLWLQLPPLLLCGGPCFREANTPSAAKETRREHGLFFRLFHVRSAILQTYKPCKPA